MKVIALIKE